MSETKKISVKKVLRFGIGALLVAIFLVTLIAASYEQSHNPIKGLEVHLNDENDFSFLQRKDIETLLLKNRHIDLARTSIDNLDLRQMEAIAKTNPWVAKADIYVDNRQVLQVNITQREPVARIFDVNGGSYYMDSILHTMPVSNGYSYPAPVFTNVPVLRNDSANNALRAKIGFLSNVIGTDSFWHAQITQIEVQPDQTFVLIPLFGNQRILLGDTSNTKGKLGHLFAFYKNVSAKIGWDKYETFDLRFKDQVVASPSIGWIPPKVTDTASLELAPATAAAIKTETTPVAATAKPTPAKTEPAKQAPAKAAVTKAAPAARSKPAKTVPAKEKQVVQAKHTPAKDKKETKADKGNKPNSKTQSPKYIYQGKKTGNN
jgi:cell division protein FtsQ